MSYQIYQLGGQTNGGFVSGTPCANSQSTQYKVAYVTPPAVQTTQPTSYPMVLDLSQMYKASTGCQAAAAPTEQYVRVRRNLCCPGCAPCCCGECDKEVVVAEREAAIEPEDCCKTCCNGCCAPEGCCGPQGNCCSPKGCCGPEGNCCAPGGACNGCCSPKGCCGPEGNCCNPNGACNGCCSAEKCCGGCCYQHPAPPPPQQPITTAPVSCGYIPIQLEPKQVAMPCALKTGYQVAGFSPYQATPQVQAIPIDRKFMWSGASVQPYAGSGHVVYNG